MNSPSSITPSDHETSHHAPLRDSHGGDVVVDIAVHQGNFALHAATKFTDQRITAIIGPNGAGKSTLLGAVAGFHNQLDGYVRRGTTTLTDTTVHPAVEVPPHLRKTVLLRQKAQLFPHMTVEQNIAFGPTSQAMSRKKTKQTVDRWIKRLNLEEFRGRYPAQLSGGQQQRVALARAFAAGPETLLLDEPTAALDVDAARLFRATVRELMDQMPVTTLLVSHTIEDVVALADHLLVLQDGQIVESGPAREHLTHPRSAFLASFAGINRISGSLSGGSLSGAGAVFTTEGITLHCAPAHEAPRTEAPRTEAPEQTNQSGPETNGARDFAAISPNAVRISRSAHTQASGSVGSTAAGIDTATSAGSTATNTWRTRVTELNAQQSGYSVTLERPAGLTAHVDLAQFMSNPIVAGDEVTVHIAPADVDAYLG